MKKLLLLTLLLSSCSAGDYEGLSAEEWFNEYDAADAENQDLQYQISDLESERDDLQNQLDDLQSQYDELQDQYDYDLMQAKDDYFMLKSCVAAWGDEAGSICTVY